MNNRQRSEQRSLQRPPPTIHIRTALNRYDLDLLTKPEGMSYEWKRMAMFQAEDTEHQIMTEMNGWTAVPAERHPELLGRRAVAGGHIVLGGLMLCERPQEITDYSRDMDQFQAAHVMASQMQRIHSQAKSVSRKLDGVKRGRPEAIPDDPE